jgi:hypothetical protein
MNRFTWAAGLMLLLVGCTVPELGDLEKERPRACNDAHPCTQGYECLGGVCLPTNVPHECVPGTTEACGRDTGECAQGQRRCGTDGNWGACEGDVGPRAEVCNDRDDDCDGQTDEDFQLGALCDMSTGCKGTWVCESGGGRACVVKSGQWHPDEDRDGQGAPGSPGIDSCLQPAGYAANALDCDDTRASRYVGAPETCNALDDDCDGQRDEDFGGPACTCTAMQAYVGGACVSRFASVTVLAPAEGSPSGRDGVTLRVRVEVKPEFASNPRFPAQLVFSDARAGGGQGGTFSSASAAGNVYEVKWVPPDAEGDFALTAAVPDGGPSATVTVKVDRTAPAITFLVPNPVIPGDPSGRTTYYDSGVGGVLAWRRDQEVTVEVQVRDPHVDPASLTLAVQGTDGVSLPVTLASSSPCVANHCAKGVVKLWMPRFDAFRGQMKLVASARDTVGNTKTENGTIPVTRWKWAYSATDSITSTPAIGARGTVYLSTRSTLAALSPDGQEKWEAKPGTTYVSTPVVGQLRDESFEVVYVAAGSTSATMSLYAYNGTQGNLETRCPSWSGASELMGSLTLLTTSSGGREVETVVGFLRGSPNRFVSMRPDTTSAERCLEFGMNSTAKGLLIPVASGFVSQGSNVFYASESSFCCGLSEVASYTFGSNQPRIAWPVRLEANSGSPVLVGPQLVLPAHGNRSDMRGIFSILTNGNGGEATLLGEPLPNTNSFGDISVGVGNEAFFSASSYSGPQLHRFPLDGGPALMRGGLTYPTSVPVLGRDGTLYATISSGGPGSLMAWSSTELSPRWTADLGRIEEGSELTLDCARNASTGAQLAGRPGVLYVASGLERRLYAIVVDSPGLDASAPWPKFQHDARNTGNPATPVTNCQ